MNADRFSYEGRAMGGWLLCLVDEDPAIRRKASHVIIGRFYRPEDMWLKLGVPIESLIADFNKAVRETINQPRFPSAEYVQKLFLLSMLLENQRLETWRKESSEDDDWHEAQAAKLIINPTSGEFRHYLKRTCIRLQHSMNSEAPEAFDTGFAISYVIDALGEELIPAADMIRAMLKSRSQAYIASAALCRMGRGALEFYKDLMTGMQHDDPGGYFCKPMGLLMRNAPERLGELIAMVSSFDSQQRVNAIMALGYCGREFATEHPEIEEIILERTRQSSGTEWYWCVSSLGEIAVSSNAVALLLETTHASNPGRVGAAISSLGKIGLDPERVVPRLIELIDGFDEYDPDWCYTGGHSRVVFALKQFVSEAEPAIPILSRHLWTKPQQFYDKEGKLRERPEPDSDVIELLGELGPAAIEVLPDLKAMCAELHRRGLEEIDSKALYYVNKPLTEAECSPEFLTNAIRKISA